jgi:hypothetical protein
MDSHIGALNYSYLGFISATPTAFAYKGVRFTFSPKEGLSFKSGKTSVRMVLEDRPYFVKVYLNGSDVGDFSPNRVVGGPEPTPKLRQVVDFGVEAWAAELVERQAKRVAANQKAVDDL